VKNLLSKILNNDSLAAKIAKNAITLSSGAFFTQLISFGFSPIITRLYGAAEYGLYSVWVSFTSFFVAVSTMAYPLAIVLPKQRDDALRLLLLSVGILVGLVFFLTLLASAGILGLWTPKIKNYIYMTPVFVLFDGLAFALTHWMVRGSRYADIAKIQVICVVCSGTTKVLLGAFTQAVAINLIIGNVVSSFAMFSLSYWVFMRESKTKSTNLPPISALVNVQTIKGLAGLYYQFPIYRAPQLLVLSLVMGLPVVVIASLFDSGAAGIYALADMVLRLPVLLLSKSIATVIYPELGKLDEKKGGLQKAIVKTSVVMILVAIPIFGTLYLLAPSLFELVFGVDWRVAGEVAKVIIFLYIVEFVSQPALMSLAVINAQMQHLLFEIVNLICRLIALYLVWKLEAGYLEALELMTLVGTLVASIFLFWVIFIANHPGSGLRRRI